MINGIISQHKFKIVFLVIASMLTGLLSIVPMLFLQMVIDSASGSDVKPILFYGGLYLVCILLHYFLRLIVTNFANKFDNTLNTQIRKTVFQSVLSSDVSQIEACGKTELINNVIEDTKCLAGNVMPPIFDISYAISSFVLGIVFMVIINPWLVLLIIPIATISTVIIRLYSKKSIEMANLAQKSSSRMWGLFSDGVKGVREIFLFKAKNRCIKDFEYENSNNLKVENKLAEISNQASSLASILFMLIIACILVIGSLSLSSGYMTIGGLVAILMYNHMLTDPLFSFVDNQKKINKVIISSRRLDKFGSFYKEKSFSTASIPFESLVCSDLCLIFEENSVIKNLSFSIEPKDRVLITGHTGCGKSSLVKILAGVLKPSSGTVLINNQPLENLRADISCAFQDGVLFKGSIIDNILFGNPTISDRDLSEIINITKLGEVLKKYEDKSVGENGFFLSGGEKTRLLLARALAHSADIYIFDEPSSGLDLPFFYEILENILIYLTMKTVIVVEHLDFPKNVFNKTIKMD